eukprot:5313235-Pyramimonas_sp.AAC.1
MQLVEGGADGKVAASAREAEQKAARALKSWEAARDKLCRKLNGHQTQWNSIGVSSAASSGAGSAAESNAAAAHVAPLSAPPVVRKSAWRRSAGAGAALAPVLQPVSR